MASFPHRSRREGSSSEEEKRGRAEALGERTREHLQTHHLRKFSSFSEPTTGRSLGFVSAALLLRTSSDRVPSASDKSISSGCQTRAKCLKRGVLGQTHKSTLMEIQTDQKRSPLLQNKHIHSTNPDS